MGSFLEVQESVGKFDQIARQRDMVTAYHRITDEMGPSAQLIAFINHDRQLGTELGLEAFETMDLDTQHVFLKANLDVTALDALATEGLKEGLIKYRNWLLLGGLVIWPLLLAGIAGYALKSDAAGKVPAIRVFTSATKEFEAALRRDTTFTASIPTTLDKGAWEKFDENVAKHPPEEKSFEAEEDDVEIGSSGWNPGSYKNAAHWIIVSNEKVKANDKKRAEKLAALDKLLESNEDSVSEVSKYISAMTSAGSKVSKDTVRALSDVQDILKKVGTHFESLQKS